MMNKIPLGLIGISHKTADVETREKVALSEEEQKQTIAFIKDTIKADGCMVLSTCNRTEIYLSDTNLTESIDQLKKWLGELKKCEAYTDENITFTLRYEEVAKHFFEVLSGLDSLIVGEPQITGQVKASYDFAHELNGTDSLINKLFNYAMHAKKKVHNDTFLSDGTASISFAGVELARKIFSDLSGKKVLLLGAGQTAELAAYHFQEAGVKDLHVINRTLARAEELALKLNGKAHAMEQLEDVLVQADIVISATASTTHVITADLMKPVAKKRHFRPIFLIDIAIPRDIDPAINSINGIFLYNIDDLHELVNANLEKRKKEIPKALKIISEHLDEFKEWVSMNSVSYVAGKLKTRLNRLRLNEHERLKSKLPQNGQQEQVEHLTESIINKVVRQHVKALKKASANPELYRQQVELIYKIYELEDD